MSCAEERLDPAQPWTGRWLENSGTRSELLAPPASLPRAQDRAESLAGDGVHGYPWDFSFSSLASGLGVLNPSPRGSFGWWQVWGSQAEVKPLRAFSFCPPEAGEFSLVGISYSLDLLQNSSLRCAQSGQVLLPPEASAQGCWSRWKGKRVKSEREERELGVTFLCLLIGLRTPPRAPYPPISVSQSLSCRKNPRISQIFR